MESRSKRIPNGMRPSIKALALIAAVPVLGIGWYLFRPELLFVNKTVNESLPAVPGQQTDPLSRGSFASYAHQTTGQAQLVKVAGQVVLRLEDLNTSNGPDVRVLLVKGNDPKAVRDGSFIDLGELKGNIGSQTYPIPGGTNLEEYGAVSIWCRRFSVNFGGAALQSAKPKASISMTPGGWGEWQTAAFTPGEEIVVTSGRFLPEASASGNASLVEVGGKRFIRLSKTRASGPVQVFLVKKETIAKGQSLDKFEKVRLGRLDPRAKTQQFPISKDIDAWLFRTVGLVDAKSGKTLAVAELRSEQERKPGQFSLI